MGNRQEEILEKILRELQDVKVIIQENSDVIDKLVEKQDKEE